MSYVQGWRRGNSPMKRCLLAAFPLLLLANHASGDERWRYAGSSDDFAIYLDFSTFKKNGDVVEVWVEYRYDKPLEFSRISSLFRIDCSKRTRQTLTAVTYDKRGAVLSSVPSPQGIEMTVPNTAGELVWGGACPEAATPIGLDQAGQVITKLRAMDPDADRKLRLLSPKVDLIQEKLPPMLWAPAIEMEWNKLK